MVVGGVGIVFGCVLLIEFELCSGCLVLLVLGFLCDVLWCFVLCCYLLMWYWLFDLLIVFLCNEVDVLLFVLKKVVFVFNDSYVWGVGGVWCVGLWSWFVKLVCVVGELFMVLWRIVWWCMLFCWIIWVSVVMFSLVGILVYRWCGLWWMLLWVGWCDVCLCCCVMLLLVWLWIVWVFFMNFDVWFGCGYVSFWVLLGICVVCGCCNFCGFWWEMLLGMVIVLWWIGIVGMLLLKFFLLWLYWLMIRLLRV